MNPARDFGKLVDRIADKTRHGNKWEPAVAPIDQTGLTACDCNGLLPDCPTCDGAGVYRAVLGTRKQSTPQGKGKLLTDAAAFEHWLHSGMLPHPFFSKSAFIAAYYKAGIYSPALRHACLTEPATDRLDPERNAERMDKLKRAGMAMAAPVTPTVLGEGFIMFVTEELPIERKPSKPLDEFWKELRSSVGLRR